MMTASISESRDYTQEMLFWKPPQSQEPQRRYESRSKVEQLYVENSLLYVNRMIHRITAFSYAQKEEELLKCEYDESYLRKIGIKNLCKTPSFLKYLQSNVTSKLLALKRKKIEVIKKGCAEIAVEFSTQLCQFKLVETQHRLHFDLHFCDHSEGKLEPSPIGSLLNFDIHFDEGHHILESLKEQLEQLQAAFEAFGFDSQVCIDYRKLIKNTQLELLRKIRMINNCGFHNPATTLTDLYLNALHTIWERNQRELNNGTIVMLIFIAYMSSTLKNERISQLYLKKLSDRGVSLSLIHSYYYSFVSHDHSENERLKVAMDILERYITIPFLKNQHLFNIARLYMDKSNPQNAYEVAKQIYIGLVSTPYDLDLLKRKEILLADIAKLFLLKSPSVEEFLKFTEAQKSNELFYSICMNIYTLQFAGPSQAKRSKPQKHSNPLLLPFSLKA